MSERSPNPADEPAEPAQPIEPDATRPIQPDATQALPGADDAPTEAIPTEILPPIDADATQVTPGGHWTGRAEVRPDAVRDAVPPEEWSDVEEPSRNWWLPILIGVVAVLVALAVIVTIVLLLRRSDEPEPTPTTPGPVVTTAAPSPSLSPTEPSPSATSATVGPTTQIEVPNLAGQPESSAKSRLDQLGLTYSVTYQEDPGSSPGTVITTVPVGGTLVAPGENIRLIVSTAPPTEEPSTSPEPSVSAS
ncbi:MAG: PASTA domain-containing protein [Hamadaea sp.]|uniref:PASTA domain-containing protein n=1 Tax=Hamadaea sp. TaxID=2024425 RepID=UPI00183880A6|nr:PASTA domain-containing protein [Hamadaea sp.]NUR71941.1 PASTA domain-containing protein [Hamadaea sp.]NUT22856.1 PASTA domain-containing protein [Hamadaea sp.]